MKGRIRTLVAGVIIVCLAGQGATASDVTFSSKARLDLFERQFGVLDGRAAEQYRHSARLLPDRDGNAIPAYRGPAPERFAGLARAAAREHGVPEDLFLRLVRQESGWNPSAVSPKGAIGLAQLMPETARAMRVDPRDPRQNLSGGARYLAEQYRRFRSWRLALAAYNAGPEAVERHGGVPPFRETEGYVAAILGR